jgi:DNA-binding XRE family transcriptional regulator
VSRKPEPIIFNRVEEIRIERGLSRQELAQLAGVHYQTIGYIERFEYNPSLSLALRISEVLQLEVSELFSLEPFAKEITHA